MGDGSQEPAYRAVMAGLRKLIAELPPDTEMPSIRAKATELGESPASVRRAYEKLRDEEHLLVSRHGKSFFTAEPRVLEPDEVAAIMRRFDDLTGELRSLAERVGRLEETCGPQAAEPVPSTPRSRRRPRQVAP